MNLKTIFQNYKESLFTVNNEPLTKLSKFFLALFVLFSFIILSISLSQQGRTIASPGSEFGYRCLYFANHSMKNFPPEEFRFKKHIEDFGSAKECETLSYLYSNARKELSPFIRQLDNANRQLGSLIAKKRTLKSEYSNTLLEKIAHQSKEKSILHTGADDIKMHLDTIDRQISQLKREIQKTTTTAKQKTSYQKFVTYSKQNAQTIKDKYNRYVRYYSFKVLLSKYLFLIPLFVMVFLLYNFAIKRKKYILSHLLLNLLNVVGIFILFYLLEFFYHIIPHTFFQKLYQLLYKLNIIAFANYISIAFFVLLFGLIIKFIQDRAQKHKTQKNAIYAHTYIKQGRCSNCGAYKDKSYKFCPGCGEKLYVACPTCGKIKLYRAKYCQECGAKDLSDENEF